MSDLFRKQAIDHATRRLAGEVVLASPLSLQLLSSLLVAVLVGALLFASLATYSRKETVPGWIVPQGGLIRVAARSPGVVQSITAHEGERVPAGTPLATVRLSTDVTTGDVGRALQRGISAEEAANTAQTAASLAKLHTQERELTERRAALEKELSEMRGRVSLLEGRQRLAEDQVGRGEKLAAKGFLAQQQLDQMRSAALAAAQDTSQARASVLDLQRQIGDLDAEAAALPDEMAGVEAQAAQSRASIDQRRTTAQSQAVFVATAPISGRVLTVPVDVGQTVGAGGAVAVLTPADSSLIAELYVPSRSAGFIRPGQTVSLMYQAFPYQTFGTGRGIVSTVSRTVLAPSEVAIPGLTVQEPVFRVRVKLDRAFVEAYGRAMWLQPGMLLSADIVTDRRNLMQWLLDPLYAAGRRA